jgi:spermidine synthase
VNRNVTIGTAASDLEIRKASILVGTPIRLKARRAGARGRRDLYWRPLRASAPIMPAHAPRIVLASGAFFASGFAALVYQIVWQRLLVLPIGADVYSTTIIVAAFMAGLGCGSLAGGHLADRVSRQRSLIWFVAAELAIGLFGVLSRFVFYDGLYLRFSSIPLHPAATSAVVFLSLVWPTFWMGMSLPLLARAITHRISMAPRLVGLLYGLNTIGAAAGASITTWILFPRLGLEGALYVAAGFNCLAALLAVRAAMAGRHEPAASEHEPATPAAPDVVPHGVAWSFRTWALLYGLAGFQALSLEIVWFRLLGVMLKSSTFTFGTLLTIFLGGLGAGAALGSLWSRCVRRPALAFLVAQAFVGLYAGASIAALLALAGPSGPLTSLAAYFARYEPLDPAAGFLALWTAGSDTAVAADFIRLYLILPAILVGPAALAMGASFPLLQRVVQVDLGHLGRRVGLALMANIAGSTLGAIGTGWIALTWIGSAGSLRGLTLVGGLFLVLAALVAARGRTVIWRAASVAAAVALAIGVSRQIPANAILWARLHGSAPSLAVADEDASGVSFIKAEPDAAEGRASVFVNGIGQSWLPYGSIHTVLGVLPAFIHPAPREAAIIGLGSGDTVYALAGRLDLARVTCIEIIRPQLATLRTWSRRSVLIGSAWVYPPLATVLSDPRIQHVFGDGRIHVMRSEPRFDIIEADALRPTSTYSGNLYSLGYFTLLRSRLAPGGFAVTWSPTTRVHDTFVQAFPYVLSFGHLVIGSNDPIAFDPAIVRARLEDPAVKEHFWRAQIDVAALLEPYLTGPHEIIDHRGPRTPVPIDLNQDLFPRDEFSTPRQPVRR